MKVNEAERTIELTRRNLLALLAKLDGHPPNSACTICSPITIGVPSWCVRAVENDAHYSDRTPGPMIEETERALSGSS